MSCPTRKAFINNLRLVKGYTADGWFPPLNFADVYNRPFFCAYYLQVVNKQFVPQFGGKQFCGKKEIVNNKILKVAPDHDGRATPPRPLRRRHHSRQSDSPFAIGAGANGRCQALVSGPDRSRRTGK